MLAFFLLLLWTTPAVAQLPVGEYVRTISPGYEAEIINLTSDSRFQHEEWGDVIIAGHPSSRYRGEIGTAHQRGSVIELRYEKAVLDSVGRLPLQYHLAHAASIDADTLRPYATGRVTEMQQLYPRL